MRSPKIAKTPAHIHENGRIGITVKRSRAKPSIADTSSGPRIKPTQNKITAVNAKKALKRTPTATLADTRSFRWTMPRPPSPRPSGARNAGRVRQNESLAAAGFSGSFSPRSTRL